MTDGIHVQAGHIADHGWEFFVTAQGGRYQVQLSQEFWKKMTHGDLAPIELVRLSFDYVREQKALDLIPKTCRLDHFADHVVDFVRVVRMKAHAESAANPR